LFPTSHEAGWRHTRRGGVVCAKRDGMVREAPSFLTLTNYPG